MSIKAFRKPPQTTPEISGLVNAIDDYVRPLTLNPLLDSVIIKRIKVSTAVADIPHGLGRPWTGWFVVRTGAAVQVYEAAKQADTTKYLSLQASGSATIDIYIF